MWLAITSLMLAGSFDSFANGVAEAVSTASPWALVLAGGLALLLLWPVLALLAQRPGQNLVDLALQAGGRPLAIGLALVLTGSILTAAGLIVREVSELAVSALFPHTPQTFIMTSLIIAAALGAAMRPPGLIWIGLIYAGPVVLSLLLVIIGNLGWGEFSVLLPITGPGLGEVAWRLLPLTSHFAELAVLTVFAKYAAVPRRLGAIAFKSMAAVAGLWTLILLVYLIVFPYPKGLAIPFPVFEMTRLMQGGRFIERLDAVWIIFWAFGSAGRIGVLLMAASLLFQGAFRLPSHRVAVLPLGVAVLGASLFTTNQADTVAAFTFLYRRLGFLPFFILPLLVALVARVRGRSASG